METPPVIERISDPAVLLTQIKECLSYGDARGLKTYVLEHKLKHKDLFWDLTTAICPHLSQQVSEDNPAFFEACERCLKYLVANGNPKEMLLALLENLEFSEDGARFAAMLPLVQATLQALPARKYHSLELALETVTNYVLTLPLPTDNELEGQEKKLLLLDKDVVMFTDALEAYVAFLRPFVEEVSREIVVKGRRAVPEALILKQRLMQLLERPLVFLELGYNAKETLPKTGIRQCAEDIVQFVEQLETNIHEFLVQVYQHSKNFSSKLDRGDEKGGEDQDEENDEEKSEEKPPKDPSKKKEEFEDQMKAENEENERILKETEGMGKGEVDRWSSPDPVSEVAVACFSYLLHVENVGKDSFPSVFSHCYMFEFNLPLVQALLKCDHSMVVDKGLQLCRHFVSLVPPHSLTFLRLDNRDYFRLVSCLTNVMIRCPVRELRRCALDLMEPLFRLFETKGRYQLFESIFATCEHAGVVGYIIRMLKNEVMANLDSAAPQDYYRGTALERLVSLALQMPGKETTDLLDQSDRIIAGLNLLRFVLLRDAPEKDLTGIWQKVAMITSEFLEPLRRAIVLSKGHYKQEFRRMISLQSQEGQGDVQVDIEIGGKKLPTRASKEELRFYHMAMNTFDMMDALLSRVEEIIQTTARPECQEAAASAPPPPTCT